MSFKHGQTWYIGSVGVLFAIVCAFCFPRYFKFDKEHAALKNVLTYIEKCDDNKQNGIWIVPKDGGRFAYYAGIPLENVISKNYEKTLIPIRDEQIYSLYKNVSPNFEEYFTVVDVLKTWETDSKKRITLAILNPSNIIEKINGCGKYSYSAEQLLRNGDFEQKTEKNKLEGFFAWSPWKQDNGIEPHCFIDEKAPLDGLRSIFIDVPNEHSRLQLIPNANFKTANKYVYSFYIKPETETKFSILLSYYDEKNNYQTEQVMSEMNLLNDGMYYIRLLINDTDGKYRKYEFFKPIIKVYSGKVRVDNISMENFVVKNDLDIH